jgi:hypothetical protein
VPNCYGFCHGFAENSVGLCFYLGDCESTDKGSSLYTCQDHILWSTTSKVLHVKVSLFARSVEEDVSDRGTQFILNFLERLHEALDTQLYFSSAYHPQTDGQTERVNQILEDVLRACALQYGRS